MANLVVIGTQWGDEGKGKIVDWLSMQADVVIRFQGGHNAGHTLVIDNKTYKLSLLPSGIIRGKKAVIGNGVVIDPYHLLSEIENLTKDNIKITPNELAIAENASLILSLHKELDALRENDSKNINIGTTKRGIGPAYEDKIARRAIRVADLLDKPSWEGKINALLHHHNALRRGFNHSEIRFADIFQELEQISAAIAPFVTNSARLLDNYQKQGKTLLFEGAQGALLDNDFGTYPFVTSSNTLAAQAALGSGVSPLALNSILGIAKAYTTRVGEGPFPTEQNNEIGEALGQKGHEFGVVTGRKRRCGWFDAVLVKQMIKLSGITALSLTKLDVLDEFSEIKICTHYEINGQKIDYFPYQSSMINKIKPIYEHFPGWQAVSYGVTKWQDLPKGAQAYINYLEQLLEVKIILVSTGPQRSATIMRQDPFSR